MKPVPTDGRAEAVTADLAAEEDDRINVDYLLQDDDDENGDFNSGGINTDDERRNEEDEIDDRPYNTRSRSPSRSPSPSGQVYQPPESGAGNMYSVPPPSFDADGNQES